MQARRGPLLGFRQLACGMRAPRCPRMLRRTATKTATIVELLDGVVQMGLRQVRVSERHRERLVAHQLADTVQVHPLHRQPRSKRMPEVMPSEVVDPGP